MVRLASLIALASWVIGTCAQNSRGHWFLNVTVGGIFDEIPQCSKACTLANLEASGCDPLDTACFCAVPDIASGLDTCLASYCPVLDYYGPQLKRQMIAVAAVALLAVILRFITRLPPLSIKWGTDDWLVAVLVLVGGCYLAVILLAIDSGFGQDIWLLSPKKVTDVIMIRVLAYLFIAACTCLMVSIFLAHLLQCLPIAYLWDQWQGDLIQQPPGATCDVERDNLNWAFGITNIILDGVIMVLPIPKIMSLELRLRRKLGLMFVFFVGFLITGIGIVKLVILLQFDFSYNRTWSNVRVVKWCAIEAFLSIAITCFPQIHLLGKRIIGIWYNFDQPSQPSKPSFISSNTGISRPIKKRATYENIEMGLK